MIIITYDESREVLFGWNYNNTDDGIVFGSKDEKVIRYFDSLFDRMKAIASPVTHLNDANKNDKIQEN